MQWTRHWTFTCQANRHDRARSGNLLQGWCDASAGGWMLSKRRRCIQVWFPGRLPCWIPPVRRSQLSGVAKVPHYSGTLLTWSGPIINQVGEQSMKEGGKHLGISCLFSGLHITRSRLSTAHTVVLPIHNRPAMAKTGVSQDVIPWLIPMRLFDSIEQAWLYHYLHEKEACCKFIQG